MWHNSFTFFRWWIETNFFSGHLEKRFGCILFILIHKHNCHLVWSCVEFVPFLAFSDDFIILSNCEISWSQRRIVFSWCDMNDKVIRPALIFIEEIEIRFFLKISVCLPARASSSQFLANVWTCVNDWTWI